MGAADVRVTRAHTAFVTYLFVVVMTGTTLPTPIYAIYAQRLDLSPTLITVIFAIYAVAVFGTLIGFGRLADNIGRRPVLLIALAFSAASAVLFATTVDLPALFVGRVLSGVSAGLVTGAATAYLTELEHLRTSGGEGSDRSALLATTANMGGLGCGPILAGVLVEHVAHPTVVPYLVDLVLLLPGLAMFAPVVPETVRDGGGWRAGARPQRLGVPPEIRVAFLAAAGSAVAAFALLAFNTALTGEVLSSGLDDHSHQTTGLVAALMLLAAAAAQVVAGAMTEKRASLVGLAVLILGVGILTAGVAVPSLALFAVGGAVGGIGLGLAFRGGLASVTRIAPDDRRGEVISTYFVAGYVGLTVPVVVTGVLVTSTTLLTATVALAVFIVILALGSAGVVIRRG